MGGMYLLRLNINSRPIAQKYREGKMQRTLERELKVPETTQGKPEEDDFFSGSSVCWGVQKNPRPEGTGKEKHSLVDLWAREVRTDLAEAGREEVLSLLY